jgi:hypothetical protein
MMTTSTPAKPPGAACQLGLRAAMAVAFFEEALEAADTLGAIAESYGQRTLLDVFYLHGALLSGDWIDAWEGESRVVEFLQTLPSAQTWLANVRVCRHDAGDEQPQPVDRVRAGSSRAVAQAVLHLARELDGYNHFDDSHTECDDRYVALKRQMRVLLRSPGEVGEEAARIVRDLDAAERRFEANGGRGVEDAEEIDRMRAAVSAMVGAAT